MSEKVEQIARSIAGHVYKAVSGARYSREHIADVAHRTAYLAAYGHVSVLEAEASGKHVEVDLKEIARLYDERRKAERNANLQIAFGALKAKRDQAIKDLEARMASAKR